MQGKKRHHTARAGRQHDAGGFAFLDQAVELAAERKRGAHDVVISELLAFVIFEDLELAAPLFAGPQQRLKESDARPRDVEGTRAHVLACLLPAAQPRDVTRVVRTRDYCFTVVTRVARGGGGGQVTLAAEGR